MTAQIVIGTVGLASFIAGTLIGPRSWLSAGLVGFGVGAGFYASLLSITDNPLAFVLDFFSRAIG
ncbi:MAG: hypothetical protein EXQ88_05495 [Alphaproteobacteria bacterium]|nr:hypothetical protein [Alphaproteobacteria bacterium]